jgi:pimeloyl-ACP methyl ester carboxylesterase
VTRRILLLLPTALALALVIAFAVHRTFGPPRPAAHYAMGRGPTIVLLHGLGSGIQHWLPVARLLARDHRVVFVELPGHGLSEMPEPFSLARATQALDEALAAETREPVVLVGHSVGGVVAANEALEHPERIRALVLVETALKPQVTGKERDALLAALSRDYQGVLRNAYMGFGRDSAQGERLYAEVARMDPATVKPWIQLALSLDISLRMRHLMAPLLAVLAERSWPKDEPWPVTAKALGYDEVPGARSERVPDCGHFIMLDRPADLARIIERFAADPAREPVALR